MSRQRPRAAAMGGFTLIEAALVLSLAGALLAAFLPTFLRHLRTSKLSEATEQLASLHRHAAAYYEATAPGSGEPLARCLPTSAGPYPQSPSASPVTVDFGADAAGAATWEALGQRSPRDLRYSYEVSVAEPGCRARQGGVAAIWLRAHGDLDGDGEPSLVERAAAPTSDRRALAPIGPLRLVARTE